MSKKILVLIIFLLLIISASQALAEEASVGAAVDFAATIFSTSTATAILNIARNLFIFLAMLSVALGLIRMLLTGEANIGALIVHITKWALYGGIFIWIMSDLPNATFIPKIIVNSFINIAGKTGSEVSVAPDDILASGIRIYGIIVERGWNAGWGDFLGITFIGIIILVVVAMIAGYIAVAIVEMHLVICGGAVLLGFGGFEYTRDIALSYIRYAISVGIKLLMITIVYALAVKLVPEWEKSFANSKDMSALITGAGQILGGTICVLMIVKIIPNIAQSIVNNAVMSFGHNAPQIGYTSYVETRGTPWGNPGSFMGNVANSFRGSSTTAGGNYSAIQNQGQVSGYTARADEVMFSEGGINQTQIRPQTGQQNEQVKPETFTHYVPPAGASTAQRVATTRNSSRSEGNRAVSAPSVSSEIGNSISSANMSSNVSNDAKRR